MVTERKFIMTLGAVFLRNVTLGPRIKTDVISALAFIFQSKLQLYRWKYYELNQRDISNL